MGYGVSIIRDLSRIMKLANWAVVKTDKRKLIACVSILRNVLD
ncbi:MAG: hypothetical protein ACHQ1H_08840 [Nitrososphaerales archaeon]